MNNIDQLRIASPCPANWDQMTGDDKSRFCSACSLNVYNVANMTNTEVEALFSSTGSDKVCLRLLRRADGTVITKDCPVGVRLIQRARQRIRSWTAIILGIFSLATPAHADQVKQNADGWVNLNLRPTAQRPGQLVQLGSVDRYAFSAPEQFELSRDNFVDDGAKNLNTFLNEQNGTAETSAQTNYNRAISCENLGHLDEALHYCQRAQKLVDKNPGVYDDNFKKSIAQKLEALTKISTKS